MVGAARILEAAPGREEQVIIVGEVVDPAKVEAGAVVAADGDRFIVRACNSAPSAASPSRR